MWLKDGSILWSGVQYKPIQMDNFRNDPDYELDMRRFSGSVCVTKSDVPVLLSERYGSKLDVDVDGVFIYGYSLPLGDIYLFCRADKYDEVTAQLGSASEEFGYCYDYYAYGSHYGENGNYVSRRQVYYLNAEQEYALSNILNSDLYYVYEYAYDYDFDYQVILYRHDALDLYREYAMRLAYSDGNYYVLMDDMVYMVRADYEQTMQDVLQAGYDAYRQRDTKWYE